LIETSARPILKRQLLGGYAPSHEDERGSWQVTTLHEHTNYQNGINMHLDWGASQFLTKQWQVGLVGYWYQQLSCDSGSGNRVGCFESRVVGIGPQIGYIFPISKEWQGYINLKGYGEFAAQNRAEGWNAWLTFVISPAAPGEAPPSARRTITK
jgi:hypothetical protein